MIGFQSPPVPESGKSGVSQHGVSRGQLNSCILPASLMSGGSAESAICQTIDIDVDVVLPYLLSFNSSSLDGLYTGIEWPRSLS